MTQIEKIANELKARHISQKDFCARLNIKPNTYSAWKMRNSNIPSRYITPICNYFGWPVHEFLDCSEENHNCSSDNGMVTTGNMSDTEDESYYLFKALPEPDKLEIMQIIMKRAREYISGMRE